MPTNNEKYSEKLWSSAPGGLVIGLFLLAWSALPLASAAKAAHALEEFRKAVATPEPLILVPVLLATFLCVAASGTSPVDWFARLVLRPAMRFCTDFCVTAAGAILPFGLSGLFDRPDQAIGLMVVAFASFAAAGWAFHAGCGLSADMSEGKVPERRRAVINWIGAVGAACIAVQICVELWPFGL